MPIKRHKALQPLSRGHHQGLILAQILKKGAPQYKGMPSTIEGKKEYAVLFYKSDLAKHFKDEEEILFPFVKNKNEDVDKLIVEIISEHRKIETLIKDLEKTDQLENLLDELGWLFEKHIRKEERELFTEIEKLMSENELSELETKLK
jgi:iron-sulfur cluster repair protein YtfE (RIC family)